MSCVADGRRFAGARTHSFRERRPLLGRHAQSGTYRVAEGRRFAGARTPLASRAASAPWTPCAERNISRRGRAPIRGRSHPTRFASGTWLAAHGATWLAAHGATWLAAHGASHGAMAASASARPDRGVAENNCTLVCAE